MHWILDLRCLVAKNQEILKKHNFLIFLSYMHFDGLDPTIVLNHH